MRKFITLSVDLIDLNTFEYREGGREFESEFKDFEINRLAFKFFDDEKTLLAEARLEKFNLQYKKFFGVELESEDEMNKHPAFFISFLPQYDVIYRKENTVNLNKIKNKNFVNDVNEKVLVVSEKAKEFLEREAPILKFELYKSDKSNKNFYVVDIPELKFPIIYKKEIELKKSEISDSYIIQSDGRVDLEQEAIEEIRRFKFLISNSFKVKGQKYLSEHQPKIISGQFLKVLKEKFDLKIEDIDVSPFTIDHI